jgi:capsular polysaccharide biosynthesis protein
VSFASFGAAVKWIKFITAYFVCAAVLVPLCFIGSLAVTVVMLVRQVPVYESQAHLRYPDPAPNQTYESFQIIQNTYARSIVSGPWTSQARAGLDRSAEELAKNVVDITATPIENTSIIAVRVQCLDPLLASDFANSLAQVVIGNYGTNTAARPYLIQAAVPSYSPVTPRKLQTIFTASVTGLLLGALLSFPIAVVMQGHKRGEQARGVDGEPAAAPTMPPKDHPSRRLPQ